MTIRCLWVRVNVGIKRLFTFLKGRCSIWGFFQQNNWTSLPGTAPFIRYSNKQNNTCRKDYCFCVLLSAILLNDLAWVFRTFKWHLHASFVITEACIIKHYRFVMIWFRSKLVCLSKPGKVIHNNEKSLAYYVSCPFSVNYQSTMFYDIGPRYIRKLNKFVSEDQI